MTQPLHIESAREEEGRWQGEKRRLCSVLKGEIHKLKRFNFLFFSSVPFLSSIAFLLSHFLVNALLMVCLTFFPSLCVEQHCFAYFKHMTVTPNLSSSLTLYTSAQLSQSFPLSVYVLPWVFTNTVMCVFCTKPSHQIYLFASLSTHMPHCLFISLSLSLSLCISLSVDQHSYCILPSHLTILYDSLST